MPFLWIAFIHICRIRQELSYLHAMRPELICSALRCVIISRVHNIGFLICIVFCCMYSPPRGICLCLLLGSGDAHDEFSCTVLCRPLELLLCSYLQLLFEFRVIFIHFYVARRSHRRRSLVWCLLHTRVMCDHAGGTHRCHQRPFVSRGSRWGRDCIIIITGAWNKHALRLSLPYAVYTHQSGQIQVPSTCLLVFTPGLVSLCKLVRKQTLIHSK